VSLQTAAVGPGGVEILVVIVLLKFLKEREREREGVRGFVLEFAEFDS